MSNSQTPRGRKTRSSTSRALLSQASGPRTPITNTSQNFYKRKLKLFAEELCHPQYDLDVCNHGPSVQLQYLNANDVNVARLFTTCSMPDCPLRGFRYLSDRLSDEERDLVERMRVNVSNLREVHKRRNALTRRRVSRDAATVEKIDDELRQVADEEAHLDREGVDLVERATFIREQRIGPAAQAVNAPPLAAVASRPGVTTASRHIVAPRQPPSHSRSAVRSPPSRLTPSTDSDVEVVDGPLQPTRKSPVTDLPVTVYLISYDCSCLFEGSYGAPAHLRDLSPLPSSSPHVCYV
ncbi:uncharacterized protein B0H18DRAFT_1119618 [Fomitopsis serialis]|uniref:uncharacterized protein n=1 Tax=Fomitopsis serialis TaxID=139415 RepID=UPI002007BC6D|nr:uncharacterized protein B0H18DRAFT_1119618 [Neoantrodia serialis]KAH9925193.1 hypothetical protein B0H18DRAFT_1119618 [Neoantrodia serialis]